MFRFAFVSFFLLLLTYNVLCDQASVRQTANGPIEGIKRTSSLGQEYYAFKGIPYAEPPITGVDPNTGEYVDRRFKAPLPLKHEWKENLNVQNFRFFCAPTDNTVGAKYNLSASSENCLFLNIYEPAGGAKKKTVLVWIHGGAFAMGVPDDLRFGEDFLIFEDNIVVTVQYRLGIFGFLNLGLPEYSGNMGLKDQQLAIKWVYENIHNFSGNKDEILIFGESAGAASVNYHMLNEVSRKYFNRAFLSSSTALTPYALSELDHLQRMKDFSQIDDEKQLIKYLVKADRSNLAAYYPFATLPAPWVPTIEKPNAVQPFITQLPAEIYRSNNAPTKDAMFSFNSKESVVFWLELLNRTTPLIAENSEESDLELLFEHFNKSTHPEAYKQSVQKLKSVYYLNMSDSDAIQNGNIDLMSDMHFCESIVKTTELQAIANQKTKGSNVPKNTFLFRFSVDADINLMKILKRLKIRGAAHSDDLCYIFHCHFLDQFKMYDEHLKKKDAIYDIIMRMVKLITNFARTGNPSLEGDTPFIPCVSPNEIYCQEITNNPKSSVTTNIKEQIHFETWREVEGIFGNLKKVS